LKKLSAYMTESALLC